MSEVKGKIIAKTITPREFQVRYQCVCGAELVFSQEEHKTCQQCRQSYQLRVTIGKA